LETELNLDPDSNPESDPELITDPDPNFQIIPDPAGSGCTTLALGSTQHMLDCSNSIYKEVSYDIEKYFGDIRHPRDGAF
jgi:hypothetical protein